MRPLRRMGSFLLRVRSPVCVRRFKLIAAGEAPCQAPLVVDVEAFYKVAEDIQVLVAGLSNFLLDAFGALTQYT